jgi:hypothetical protein
MNSCARGHEIKLCSSNHFFHAVTMLSFYITQKVTVPKFCIFRKIFNHASSCGTTVSGASVDPTSQVSLSAMLILPVVENLRVRF